MIYSRPLSRCPIWRQHGYQYWKNNLAKCKYCGQLYDITKGAEVVKEHWLKPTLTDPEETA